MKGANISKSRYFLGGKLKRLRKKMIGQFFCHKETKATKKMSNPPSDFFSAKNGSKVHFDNMRRSTSLNEDGEVFQTKRKKTFNFPNVRKK